MHETYWQCGGVGSWTPARFQRGESVRTVADRFGVNPSSVKRWRRDWREGGEDGLAAKPHPGGKCKLSASQIDELVELVVAGPREAGSPTDLWTCARMVELIRDRFGVEYDRRHLAKLLRRLGFTPQKPRTVARGQDPKVVKHWRKVEWLRINKKPAKAAPASTFSTKRTSCSSR